MPDWKQIVGQELGRMKLPPEEQGEVIAELAAHLEECYGELCAAGSPDPEGYALAQVPDWKALGRRIQKSKEGPMSFTRKVLIPGLAALFLSQVIMSVSWHMLAPLNGSPAAWQFEWPGIVSSYPAWLVMLPLAGGLGAWLARRAGASLRQRLTAALFPAFYAPVALVSLVIRVLFFAPERAAEPLSLSTFLLAWVLAPAVACVLGALPLLWGAPRTAQAPPTHAASA